jgi:hypothetical protein
MSAIVTDGFAARAQASNGNPYPEDEVLALSVHFCPEEAVIVHKGLGATNGRSTFEEIRE